MESMKREESLGFPSLGILTLVVRDTMYIPDVGEFTKDKMGVIALNAKTGAEIWKKEVTLSTVKDNVYYTRSSRG